MFATNRGTLLMTMPPLGARELRSTLGRLFMYSKDSLVLAHENFTTEALAVCIRADPEPMLSALREIAGLQPPLSTPVSRATWLRTQTQVFPDTPNPTFSSFVARHRALYGATGYSIPRR
jgi:hypothetical protein